MSHSSLQSYDACLDALPLQQIFKHGGGIGIGKLAWENNLIRHLFPASNRQKFSRKLQERLLYPLVSFLEGFFVLKICYQQCLRCRHLSTPKKAVFRVLRIGSRSNFCDLCVAWYLFSFSNSYSPLKLQRMIQVGFLMSKLLSWYKCINCWTFLLN